MPKTKEKKEDLEVIDPKDVAKPPAKGGGTVPAALDINVHVSALDQLVYQALVNEGKHTKLINAKKPILTYNGELAIFCFAFITII